MDSSHPLGPLDRHAYTPSIPAHRHPHHHHRLRHHHPPPVAPSCGLMAGWCTVVASSREGHGSRYRHQWVGVQVGSHMAYDRQSYPSSRIASPYQCLDENRRSRDPLHAHNRRVSEERATMRARTPSLHDPLLQTRSDCLVASHLTSPYHTQAVVSSAISIHASPPHSSPSNCECRRLCLRSSSSVDGRRPPR